MEVNKEIFDVLWEYRGKSFGEFGDDNQEFLYSMLSESSPLGLVQACIPPLNTTQLEDWTEFEYWLNDIDSSFDLCDLNNNALIEIDFDGSTPTGIFGYPAQIHQAAINLIKRSEEPLHDRSIWATEINHGNKNLFLLYSGLSGWGLGHSYSVDVVESLATLTEENGYFQIG